MAEFPAAFFVSLSCAGHSAARGTDHSNNHYADRTANHADQSTARKAIE